MPEWTCLVCDPPTVIPYAKQASSTAVWRGHCARVHPDGTTPPNRKERLMAVNTSVDLPDLTLEDLRAFVSIAQKSAAHRDSIIEVDFDADGTATALVLLPIFATE